MLTVDSFTIHHEIEKSNICEDNQKEVKESVDYSLSIHGGETRNENYNIFTEVKEEGIDDGTVFVLEIHNYGDEENNTVVDDIDIVYHKMKLMIDPVLMLSIYESI